jgi:tetratricopeptide (TPR) repeat protein
MVLASFPGSVDAMTNREAANPKMGTTPEGARIESVLSRMRELSRGPGQAELIRQFGAEDIAGWPAAFAGKAVEALRLRGQAYSTLKDYTRAERDLRRAVDLSPGDGYGWNTLAEVYLCLKDDQRALDAYQKAFEADRAQHTAKSFGWMPINATLGAANILLSQTKYEAALQVLARYDDSDIQKMGPGWGSRMLRTYGQIYAGLGREEEALASFKAALKLEKT